MKIQFLGMIAVLLSSCTTVLTKEGLDAKARLEQKANGKQICWETGVWDFTHLNATMKPSEDCLYPTSKIFLTDVEVPVQNTQLLRIRQGTDEGFLVEGILFAWQNGKGTYKSNQGSDNVVFIYKGEQKDKVDGSFIDDSPGDLYQYIGVYRYPTAIGGSKSVHSFKKIQN